MTAYLIMKIVKVLTFAFVYSVAVDGEWRVLLVTAGFHDRLPPLLLLLPLLSVQRQTLPGRLHGKLTIK